MNAGGFIDGVVRTFVDSRLTPLLFLSFLLLGAFAILETPREEEPQIVVFMADVFVELPGRPSKEVEERITTPLEKYLAEIPGVEYLYSVSSPGLSMITVVFYLDEDEAESLVKVHGKLASYTDQLPPEASPPLIKPRSIDDVPFLTLTFWGQRYDHYMLRRIVAQLDEQIRNIPNVGATTVIGGQQRQLRVIVDPARMSAFHVDLLHLTATLRQANEEQAAGSFTRDNTEYLVTIGGTLRSAHDIEQLVVGTSNGQPVYLSDVATVEDGPEEVTNHVFFSGGPAAASQGTDAPSEPAPAVTLAVAKRRGTNAVVLVERVLAKVEALKGDFIPADVHVTVTRNYGDIAQEKVNELLEHLVIAVSAVAVLIAMFLGVRAALVVLIAVPATLALTLFFYYLFGHSLNRVTFFGLIFSIGILVDDPIVDVENIVRHYRLPENRGRPLLEVTVEAVNEVRSPLILATLTVIFAILPVAFLPGMVGSYARPVPIGAAMAMAFSMLIAFLLTPWAAYRLLKQEDTPEGHTGEEEGWATQLYRRMMIPLIRDPGKQRLFLGGVALLFVGSLSLLYAQFIDIKILPFDNKPTLNVIINMPEGTPLEATAKVTQEIGRYLGTVPEITDYQLYIGTAAPYNFNGLVRRYFLRQGPHMADISVSLLPKGERTAHSHDIAKRIRPEIQAIARRSGGRVTIAEVPPGPPNLQTLVAEVYGPAYDSQVSLAHQIRDMFENTPGVVDVDWSVEAPWPIHRLVVDKEKAALHGIPTQQIVQTLIVALSGMEAGLFHLPQEKEPVRLFVRLPTRERSGVADLTELTVLSPTGEGVPVSELVRVAETTMPPFIYHKNLKPVVYVTGDIAGVQESPLYALLTVDRAVAQLPQPEGAEIPRFWTALPFLTEQLAIKWDGEWHTTYEFVGGLGLAFTAVMILIYLLVVSWFQSYKIPLVILVPIPLSLIGILPVHALVDVFFSGTSAIGFIAGAGIVVRNSIILVDFIELRRAQGMPLAEAVVDAGAIRFRPMLLTALSVVAGAAVILLDPIFQGMALSLIAGEITATFLSRIAVPLLYYLSERESAPRPVTAAVADSVAGNGSLEELSP